MLIEPPVVDAGPAPEAANKSAAARFIALVRSSDNDAGFAGGMIVES